MHLMNKNAFLKALKTRLRKLKNTERRKYISFYEELISDMAENGMSEEAAVGKIGSLEDISEAILKDAAPEDFKKKDRIGRCLIAVSFVLLVLTLLLYQNFHTPYSTSVIGGADGPTSIFIAGKTGSFHGFYLFTAAFISITVVYKIFRYVKKQ